MRTFIIGDIHGCYDELIELTQKIGLKDEDVLVSLGDIVDRGNKSKEVYEFFRKRPNSVVLMGNHERKHQKGILSFAQEIVKVQFGTDYETFLTWLNTLDYAYESEDALVVHAFFEHDKSLQEQKIEVLCGSTSGDRYLEKKYPDEKKWTAYYSGVKPIIYGHHVVGIKPLIFNNTYGIDTGACHGDFLTAIELPGFVIHQIKAKKDYWKEEQRIWQLPVLKAKNWGEMTFAEIDKLLEKFSYLQEPEVVKYLSEMKQWSEELQNSYQGIKTKIDNITLGMLEKYEDNFSTEANKSILKTYFFKSKSNNLTIADLKKVLNTPKKIAGINRELETAEKQLKI